MKTSVKSDRARAPQPSVVYHMTNRKNVENILKSGKILADWAGDCFFFKDLKDISTYIVLTGALKGRQYYDKVDGVLKICTAPPLVIEDTVVFALKPRYNTKNWYKEITLKDRYNESDSIVNDRVKAFDDCRIMHHGDMKFKSNPEIIELSSILTAEELQATQEKWKVDVKED